MSTTEIPPGLGRIMFQPSWFSRWSSAEIGVVIIPERMRVVGTAGFMNTAPGCRPVQPTFQTSDIKNQVPWKMRKLLRGED
jgi:hypothetical protein